MKDEGADQKDNFLEKVAPYIINPRSKYKIAWDMLLGFFYLIVFWLDPLVFVFAFKPLASENIRSFTILSTVLFIFDIFVTLFTGVRKQSEIKLAAQREETESSNSAENIA